jgi:hypothetical protein
VDQPRHAGRTVAVRSWDAAISTLTLFLPALYPTQTGDALTIRPGWDKTFATCKAKFQSSTTRSSSAACRTSPGNNHLLSYPDAER